ncbi:MAG: helix-hairpin-helix domain-containing protein [Phycisphaerales bacterium]|nr:helix-hairpin-helix domain-containing protein [Phycisphaerales bacterium]
MTNTDISEFFSALSKLMDLHGEDSFKSKSYSIAAYTIDQLEANLADMDDATLRSSKGIGASTAAKIREILDTGKLMQLEEIMHRTPSGVLDIMHIKGLGPKKVRTIWQEMGIESVGELEYACHENRLAAFKGFGQKTQEAVLQNIAFIRNSQGFQLWASAEATAHNWIARLKQSFAQYQFLLTGAFYRQMETVAAIEIVSNMPADTLPRLWANAPGIEMSHEGNTMLLKMSDNIPIRFYFADKEKVAITQFRNACSETFLTAFEAEYIFPEKAINEADIFKANHLQFIPAPMRESAEILEKSKANVLPTPIELSDIKGIIHSHSKWSDGQETLETMVQHAISKGLQYLVISDHSQAAYYANGLSPDRVAAQQIEIDALNQKYAPFKIFKSIEADILNDGSLDYDHSALSTFDLVIASVHSNLKMTQEKAMQRLLSAIQNPFTTILGHPTGRLLLSREGYPIDHKMIIEACSDYDVVIEINAHPRRLDLDWQWVEYAMSKGVLLSINPDAHSLAGFDDIYYGCKIAQKAGLTATQNLSSFSLVEMEKFVESKKRKRNLQPL